MRSRFSKERFRYAASALGLALTLSLSACGGGGGGSGDSASGGAAGGANDVDGIQDGIPSSARQSGKSFVAWLQTSFAGKDERSEPVGVGMQAIPADEVSEPVPL